jgi:hypothetical protein
VQAAVEDDSVENQVLGWEASILFELKNENRGF